MKREWLTFICISLCLLIQSIKEYTNVNRTIASLIVWIIQYPLFIISVYYALTVFLNISNTPNKFLSLIFTLPTICFTAYFIYKLVGY